MIAHLLLLGPWGGLQEWGVRGLCQYSAGAGPQTTQNNPTSVTAWDPQGMETCQLLQVLLLLSMLTGSKGALKVRPMEN